MFIQMLHFVCDIWSVGWGDSFDGMDATECTERHCTNKGQPGTG